MVSAEPTLTRLTVPALARVLIVSAPPRRSVVPARVVTPEEAVRRALPRVASVPALTAVAPAKVFAPERVSVAPPSLIRPPLETTPAKVMPEAVVNVRSTAPRSMSVVNVSSPELTASPKVTGPASTSALASVYPVVLLLESWPAVRVSVPVPSAELWPIRRMPPLRSSPPEKVLAPESVTVPIVDFTAAIPAPPRMALTVPARRS